MIYVVATIDVVPGRREAFLQEFQKLLPKMKAVEGCLDYNLTVDCPTKIGVQIPVRDNVVTVVEKWTGPAALEAHLAGPAIAELLEKTKGLLAGLQIQVLQPS